MHITISANGQKKHKKTRQILSLFEAVKLKYVTIYFKPSFVLLEHLKKLEQKGTIVIIYHS